MGVIWDKFAALVFPPVCPLCGEVLSASEELCCGRCKTRISYVKEPCCLKCGAEVENPETEYCGRCRVKTRHFVRGFPAMHYTWPVDDAILEFKFHGKKSYAEFFAKEILRRHGAMLDSLSAEVLVPVPIHRRKRADRGYNQAELLARELSKLLDIPVDTELICREKNTKPQKELNPEERENNLKTAFQPLQKSVNYKVAVLVDDIYTTGATVEACACLLRDMGVEQVYYTSICIAH